PGSLFGADISLISAAPRRASALKSDFPEQNAVFCDLRSNAHRGIWRLVLIGRTRRRAGVCKGCLTITKKKASPAKAHDKQYSITRVATFQTNGWHPPSRRW
ncbi:hypothetical protein VN97_g3730, partial [Penicillium thymicola]